MKTYSRNLVPRLRMPRSPSAAPLPAMAHAPECTIARALPAKEARAGVTARGRSGVRTKVEHMWAQRMPALILTPNTLGFQPLNTQSVCTDPVGLAP